MADAGPPLPTVVTVNGDRYLAESRLIDELAAAYRHNAPRRASDTVAHLCDVLDPTGRLLRLTRAKADQPPATADPATIQRREREGWTGDITAPEPCDAPNHVWEDGRCVVCATPNPDAAPAPRAVGGVGVPVRAGEAADFVVVAGALRALADAWVRDRVPSRQVGLDLSAEATLALSRLAAAARVPLGEARALLEQGERRLDLSGAGSCDCPPGEVEACRRYFGCTRFNTRVGNAP